MDGNRDRWENWVDECPIMTFVNFHGNRWTVFKSADEFKKWLKEIPLFLEEKTIKDEPGK